MLRLLEKRNTPGQSFGINDWLTMLTEELGTQAMKEYEAMASAKSLLVLPRHSLGPDFEL